MAEERHLLLVPRVHGYELAEREGAAPEVGTEIELDGSRYVVTRVAAPPLPDDDRRCAYLQHAPA